MAPGSPPEVSEAADLLTQSLAICQNPTRAPDGFDKALQASCDDPTDSIPRQLLRRGLICWFAWFLAHRERPSHVEELLRGVDLGSIAAGVLRAEPHESVHRLLSRLFESSRRSKQRNDWLRSIGVRTRYSEVSEQEAVPSPQPREEEVEATTMRAEVEGNSTGTAGAGAGTGGSSSGGASETAPGDEHTVLASGPFENWQPDYQVAMPRACNLGWVFPMYLTSVILKQGDLVCVRCSFPADPTQCELDKFISSADTQHVAKELFGKHFTIRNGEKILLLKDGRVSVGIRGSLTLSGSSPQGLTQLLGSMVVEASEASSKRKDELRQGLKDVTSCVFMEVWPDAAAASRLGLTVSAELVMPIVSFLWTNGW